MARSGGFDAAHERSISGLGADLFWFALHFGAAIALLMLVVATLTLAQPAWDPGTAKLITTGLAILVPMAAAFAMSRVWVRRAWCWPARFTWVGGLLVLAAAAVWVLGSPTGPGLCEGCGAAEKLWRTFFVFEGGSGLMNGDGLLVGCWFPLASAAYSLGASVGLRR